MQIQEGTHDHIALIVASKNATNHSNNIDENSIGPAAEGIKSNLSHSLDNEPSTEIVPEAHIQELSVREPDESAHSHAVNLMTTEETAESGDITNKVNISDSKQSVDDKTAAAVNEYYVQVGSWKNLNYAKEIFIELKQIYADVHLVEQNGFHKVRISGILSKKNGAMITKKIRRKFNIQSLLVLREQNRTLSEHTPTVADTAPFISDQNPTLADAVRPLIGTSYTKINCYGLIVMGLIKQGIQYYGHDGLGKQLANLALLDGLPEYAYLNGEGLVEKVGETIYSDSIHKISNAREATDIIYTDIAPYLREGLILSFSTTTRGHTGIISRQEDIWTYINSGVIDNQVSPSGLLKGVGEEFLKAEIKNWVVLAFSRKEPLTVTLGQIDTKRLKDFDRLKKANKITAFNM
ncbi:MAG: hypothetical protein JSW20_02360 [Nitrospiraceae bacterium]|nr:MAG: hypothetical protein JSW20_02360 [Nitrospiraceae bacterium]